MIPIILLINDIENIEGYIEQIAIKNNIKKNHRLTLKSEKNELLLEDIKQVKTYCSQSYSNPILITLVNIDRSSEEVQNSLLKILEEESHRFLFLLVVDNYYGLLPTIQSRCILYNYASYKDVSSSKKTFSFSENIFKTMNTYSKASKEDVVNMIDFLIENIHKFKEVRKKQLLEKLLSTRSHILHNNVNHILALDSLLFFLLKRV